MAMDLNAKAAYIRGMMKGMEFDPTTQEGKIIVAKIGRASCRERV